MSCSRMGQVPSTPGFTKFRAPSRGERTFSPGAAGRGRLVLVAISIDDLRSLAARARAQAETAGELRPTGPVHLDLSEPVRKALWEALDSGAYEEAAQAATADDPEMTQL